MGTATGMEMESPRSESSGVLDGETARSRVAFVDDHPTLLMGVAALFALQLGVAILKK